MIILGIDPGFSITGFGVLKKEGHKAILLDYGFLKLPSTKPLYQRVQMFHDFMKSRIETFSVTKVSIETSFLGKNAQNFLKLGYLRGIIYLLASQYNLELHEYTPREVKQSVTGFGGADKEQVATIIKRLFPLLNSEQKLDVTDALAITLCCLWDKKGIYQAEVR